MNRHPELGQSEEQEEVTGVVCQEADLEDGQMREVTVGDQKVLLVRTQGQYSAVGSQCSHYNAPLVKGALVGDRVRCPFHGACFNVRTGDIEEYPGLDCLPIYRVKVEDGKVYVSINKKSLTLTKRVKKMCSMVPDIKHTVLLVGGGPASLVCAETLRQNCYQGRVIIITKDTYPPFDKPKLSKAMNLDVSSILLRSGDFYQQYGIEVWTQKEVVSVNPADKTVKLSDGALQHYDQLLVSTGCKARPLNCPGGDLKGVKLLQSYEDMLEEHNVKFYMNDAITEIRGEHSKVTPPVDQPIHGPETKAICFSGVIPTSDFLTGSGVKLDSRKAVIVDKFMRTNIPDVFSAGDVTTFPLTIRGDQRVNVGHWQMSQAQGRVAALNMLKKPTKIESVPFFWTVLLGKSIRYTGYGEGYTEIIFKGKVEERKFLAFYIKDEVVVAAASLMFDPAVARIAELMATGQVLTKAQAQADDLSWLQM
uniref:Apoptosis inducing factor mitochondria associated 4 n=1 Tax=Mastacembelus armatus TaxID=205130 RepID=A0A7N8XIH0_9TELE